jgi:S-adenosylmethionine:tRNA ribosyltransferase-isomerase
MDIELFNFSLPEELIALRPACPRDSARLLQVSGAGNSDHIFNELTDILRPGDVLILNETKVLSAALKGIRAARPVGGGGSVELQINLHQQISPNEWRAFARPAKRLKLGDIIEFSKDLTGEVFDKKDGGDIGLRFNVYGDELANAIEVLGDMPLPPYIARRRPVDVRDTEDYQTVFANQSGSVAAPTAGLHFTDSVFKSLKIRGIEVEYLTLHVGAGTFLPVSHADTDDHKMHAEWFSISDKAAANINKARREARRIIAVGTTALRALESSVSENGDLIAQSKETDIFIMPGYEFRIVDGLLTNFHLPKSTLFMLVSALAGLENMRNAYQYAIDNQYRFYSYGDTSLLWNQKI